MKTKTFVVPHDFTEVANVAMQHALATAANMNAEVILLHVVARTKDIDSATIKLKEIIAKQDPKAKIVPNVRVGNIFEDIGEFAAENSAELIFMGTHGIQGWQHVTGSNALKVVTNSNVPFIIVQPGSSTLENYDNIVVPLDLNKETKQKLAIVANLAIYFKSRVHLITQYESNHLLKKQIDASITFANKFFQERNIEVTTKIAPSDNFDKEIVQHAKAIKADLIAFMNMNKNNLFGVVTANYETYLLNNTANIPVLVVNPIEGLFN